MEARILTDVRPWGGASTDIVISDGRSMRVDHDWAESFVQVRCDDAVGLAHYECVVITDP